MPPINVRRAYLQLYLREPTFNLETMVLSWERGFGTYILYRFIEISRRLLT